MWFFFHHYTLHFSNSVCSHSSRCACILVWRQCSSLNTGRAWQCHCAGAGPQCSWGSPYSWIHTGCFCLLALLSIAWLEPPLPSSFYHLSILCDDKRLLGMSKTYCSLSAELQLKARHQPYKLCRQWQDLLYRFTDASEEDISQGLSTDGVLLGLHALPNTWQKRSCQRKKSSFCNQNMTKELGSGKGWLQCIKRWKER